MELYVFICLLVIVVNEYILNEGIVKLSIEPRSWIHNPQKRSDGGKEDGEDLTGSMSGLSLHTVFNVGSKNRGDHYQAVTKKTPQAWSCF